MGATRPGDESSQAGPPMSLAPASEEGLTGLAAYAAAQEASDNAAGFRGLSRRGGLTRASRSSGCVQEGVRRTPSGGLSILAESASQNDVRPMRRESTWSTWEVHNAQEGAAPAEVDPATLGQEEADFNENISVKRYVKYFLKSVLNYDAEKVIGPGVFLAATTAASILMRKQLLRDMFIVLVLATVLGATLSLRGIKLDQVDIDRLSNLVKDFQSLCTFLLGFFVSTCLARWWSMRNDCIGALWGCADDLTLIIGSYFGSSSDADREVREKVLRWSVLSHELVYKQAKADEDLSDLVTRGFLLEHELAILVQEVSKPQVIWAWMCSYFSHLAYGDPQDGGSRLPYPVTVLPQLHEICRKARGGIGSAFAYTDTQVPFRYVHFLAMIIWMNNIFQAVNSAVVISDAHLGKQPTAIGVELVFLIFHPLIYFGLLHLGVGMLNPLRSKRDIDFPSGAWTYFQNAEMKSLFCANVEPSGPPWGKPPVWQPPGSSPNSGPNGRNRGSGLGGGPSAPNGGIGTNSGSLGSPITSNVSRSRSLRGTDTHVYQDDLYAALQEEMPQD